MTTEHVLAEVHRERLRQETLKAESKFRYTCADPGMPDEAKMLCLVEEMLEANKALLGQKLLTKDDGNLREELIHVAAVAVAWAESIRGAP